MTILNFGSLNLDRVFVVDRIARPGESVISRQVTTYCGGKGANQSVALARAGATVVHAGKIGPDGSLLVERLQSAGAGCRWILRGNIPTGQAIIQVEPSGENAIVYQPGANHAISRQDIELVLEANRSISTLLVQNEISQRDYLLAQALQQGLKICFNPAPFDQSVLNAPLGSLQTIVINEAEGAGITETAVPSEIVDRLATQYPTVEILLTLGAEGVIYRLGADQLHVPSPRVTAIDTTGAGDTFIGFFIAARTRGENVGAALDLACRAAAICVQRRGAMDAIPTLAEVHGG